MKAAIFHTPGAPIEIADIGIDKPGPDEVLIRTVASGVCHSDLHVINGSFPSKLPVVLGHESAGVIEAVGANVRRLKAGDHVITCISGFCGHCQDCLTGHTALCETKGVDRPRGTPPRLTPPAGATGRMYQFGSLGGWAELMLVHERTCVAIRPDMPLDRAAVIGCAVTTGIGAIVHTAKVEPGATVAVVGCGGIGLMAINGAAIAGASRIIAIDRVPAKLELAKTMGATDVIDANNLDIVEAVREMTQGGVNYSFEAIGLKATAEQAFRMVRQGGTATIIGVAAIGTNFEIGAMDLLMERKLQGSYMGSNRFPLDMPRFIDFYMQGRLHLDELVAQRMPLSRINEAVAELETGQTARSVITFD